MVIAGSLALLGACAAEPEREARSSATPSVSVETFMPDNIRSIFRRSCESCHGYDGHGIAGIAPNMLSRSERSAEEWVKYFSDLTNGTKSLHPGAQAPSAIWMNQDEIKAVAAFLADLNGRSAAPAETP